MAKFPISVAVIVLAIYAAVGQSQNYGPLQPPTREYLPPNRGQEQAGQGQRPAQSQQQQGPASSAPQAQSYAAAPAQPPRPSYLPPGGQSQPRPQSQAPQPQQQPQRQSAPPAQPPQQQAPQPSGSSSAAAQQPPRSTYLPPGGQSQSQPQSQAQQYQPQRQSAPPAPVQPPPQQQPQPQSYASASAQQPPRSTYLPPGGQSQPRPQQQPQRQSPPAQPQQQQPQGYSSAPAQQPPQSTYLPPSRPSTQQKPSQPQPQAQLYYNPPDEQQSDPRPRPNYASASAQSPNSGAPPPPQPLRPVYGLPGHTPGEPLGLPGAETRTRRQQCPPNDNARNKALVMAFYQEVIGDKNFDAVDKYLTERYINHNPMVGDGREVFKQVLGGFLANAPRIKIDFRRISAEDDLVWVHTRATNFGPMPEAVVDIFRIECGLIAEHWDVMQPITENGPNPHAFF